MTGGFVVFARRQVAMPATTCNHGDVTTTTRKATMNANELRKLPTRQKLDLLCTDDIIRNPKTGRLARLAYGSGERGNVFTCIPATDLETGEDVTIMLRNSVTVSVYIG